LQDASSLEIDPNTSTPLLVLVSCPVDNRPEGATRLWGKLKIKVSPDSLAFRIYQRTEVAEAFNCNYELNPDFRGTLEATGLRVSGVNEDGGARIIELPDHHFFMATGFVPQFTSEETKPHPLIVAYLEAALNYRRNEGATKNKGT
jgi:CTP synthase